MADVTKVEIEVVPLSFQGVDTIIYWSRSKKDKRIMAGTESATDTLDGIDKLEKKLTTTTARIG